MDLEAARDGTRSQASVVRSIVEAVGIPCQVAGGIRDLANPRSLVADGVDRVVMGTALVRDPDVAPAVLAAIGPDAWSRRSTSGRAGHGQRLDRRRRSASGGRPHRRLRDAGVTTFAVTAIARDGLMTGPDLGLLEDAARRAGGHDRIIASAGVSTLDDIRALAGQGYAGAILGRALYEGRFELADALALVGD